MLTIKLKHLLRDLTAVIGRVEAWLTALGFERRCARRLDAVADRLTNMGNKIDCLRARLGDSSSDEPVDDNAALTTALKGLKEDIREIRCQLAGMSGGRISARVERAIARLSAIAEKTYASADKLQWEITEHDARFVQTETV